MSSPPWSPNPAVLAQHPELGHLALLAHQLDLLTAALTLVHGSKGHPEALTANARAMVQVVRILQMQIDTYRQLLTAYAEGAIDPRSTRSSRSPR